ncbi:hypothetical protein [Variovorax sp. MHTC-1]|uniref:hypothetical protein n=1 Tax=Variovorax sp. MHTC-1 TaxID=2495593 RepID=UPI000F889C61|nr:hypothetical protein [Variovorax sp. MHTC-1]RST48868.1 hypothetical protein EJI01_25405 [Variovorax sp. MHTC-1]
MTALDQSAKDLVASYLCGRRMIPMLLDAVVWMAAKRLSEGETPVLDDTLRGDIDSQAELPQAARMARISGLSVVSLGLRRSDAAMAEYFPELLCVTADRATACLATKEDANGAASAAAL